MLYDRLRVFVSSKMEELAAERVAVKEILDGLNVDAWVFEQDAGARPGTIQESYREELEASDLYIGLFWKSYGAYTVEEFELARAVGTDCLIYQKGGDRPEGRDPQLQTFLDRISKVESGLTIQWFETPEELREMVKRDTARWQTRIVRKYREGGPRRGVTGLPADPDLAVLGNKVKLFWVDGVLGRSIAEAGLVDVSKRSRPDAVGDSVEAILELPYEGSRVIDPGTSVAEIFERLERSLLILGEPGSGKTTTALQLTRDLITKAERDESQPVPVVLNLSAWSPEWHPLRAWIEKEIRNKYHVPARISRPWLEQDRLVLILDGLDEVAAVHRTACVDAIDRFVEEYGVGGLVVTSRLEEYEALPVRLHTHGAICLRPLRPAQVDEYLKKGGEHLAGLRTALETDEALQELARSPLMLSVMSRAYRDRPAVELEAGATGSAEARRMHLFGTYVERAFDQGSARSYSRQATMSWLSWLAQHMSERSQTLFLIEDLQPSWLATRAQLGAYLLGFAALCGLVYGTSCIFFRWAASAIPGRGWADPPLNAVESVGWLVAWAVCLLWVGITDGLRFGEGDTEARTTPDVLRRFATNLLLAGLLWAPIALLVMSAEEPKTNLGVSIVLVVWMAMSEAALGARRSLSRSIKTAESLRLEWASAGRGALWGLLAGAVLVAPGELGLIPWVRGMSVSSCLTATAAGAILGGFEPHLVRGKTIPNQGMSLTIKTSVRAPAMALPMVAIPLLVLFALGGEYRTWELLAKWLITGLVIHFSYFTAWFGGLDVAKHYLVRAVIGATRQGPWDFPRLLDDASQRNLMQRVGGGYIFVHRLLLDHFAAMDLPPPAADEVRDSEREHAASSWPAIAAMVALALIGAVTLFVSLETNVAAAVVGTVLLASGALWLVLRTAVAGALRAGLRDREDE